MGEPLWALGSAVVDYETVLKDLQDFIPRQMDKAHVKGLSLALVDETGAIWSGGFGWADADRRIPATADTLYPVGPVTELLTAGEILKLSREGIIGLDDPLTLDLPSFHIHSRFGKTQAISLRSLLADHSGLPAFFIKGTLSDLPPSLVEIVSELKDDYLTAPPQTLYKYSYVDYDLLGRVIEKRRGMDFSRAMDRDWLQPLGMTRSTFRRTGEVENNIAKGYLDGKETPFFHMKDVPATGLFSTARDMTKFLAVFLGTSLRAPPLSPSAVEEMFQPQYAALPLNFGHEVGMGWMLSGLKIDGVPQIAWHDGVYPPYVCEAAVLKKQKLGVIFLANSEEAIKIEDEIVIRALKLMLNAKYGRGLGLEKQKVKMQPIVPVPQALLDRYAGFYSAAGQLTSIQRRGNHLSTVLLHTGLDLVPISQDTFVPRFMFLFLFPVDFPENAMTFSTAAGYDVTVFNGFTYPLALQKITPVPIPDAWKEREGKYIPENPDDWMALRQIVLGEKDGFLEVALKASFPAFNIRDRDYELALEPLSDTDAFMPGLFYGDGGTLHSLEKGGITRIFYSGYWFRKQ